MRVTVSLPDDLSRRADEPAARLGKSRSQVYREALEEYAARRDPDAVTTLLNQVVDQTADAPDEWSRQATEAALRRSEW